MKGQPLNRRRTDFTANASVLGSRIAFVARVSVSGVFFIHFDHDRISVRFCEYARRHDGSVFCVRFYFAAAFASDIGAKRSVSNGAYRSARKG